jgi:hypothetical protein
MTLKQTTIFGLPAGGQETQHMIQREYITNGGEFASTLWISFTNVQENMLESQQTNGKSPLFWNNDGTLKYAAGAHIDHEL